MKILLVTFEFPPQKGGMQTYYYNLAKLFNFGEIIVLTSPFEKAESFDQKQGFKIIREKLLSGFVYPRWLKLLFLIKKIVKEEKIDLIWVGDTLPVGEAVYFLNWFFKIPYFISVHGLDILLTAKTFFKKIMAGKIFSQAGFIAANSHYTKNLLNRIKPDLKTKVIVVYPCSGFNGQEHNQLSAKTAELKTKLGWENKKILLSVGRLVERKGQSSVIRILPELLRAFPDLVYVIVGNGPRFEYLKKLAKVLNIESHVYFAGESSDADLPFYYSAADIFVMPTQSPQNNDIEGFGIVYLEAAAFGLPVVAANIGGVGEAVVNGQTGLLIEPGNSQELAEKITLLLNDKVCRQKLSQNAQMRAKQDFNWQVQFQILKQELNNYERK